MLTLRFASVKTHSYYTNRLSRKVNSHSVTKKGMANAAVNIRHKVFVDIQ